MSEPTTPAPSLAVAFAERFASTRPRDRGGAINASRTEYQKLWAMCELLRRHQLGEDYCFVFEFHDDVVILDSGTNPQVAEFFQVKTRALSRGNWTLVRLADPDEDDPASGSILGKLFRNLRLFPDNTRALTVVSNGHYKLDRIATADKDALEFGTDELTSQDLGKIKSHLEQSYAPVTDAEVAKFRFARSEMGLRDASTHALGHVQSFLENRRPGAFHRVAPAYRTLLDEISARTGREDLPSTFEELTRTRALSRADFDRHLKSIEADFDAKARIESLLHRLGTAGWGWQKQSQLRTAWNRYTVDRMNPDNEVAQALCAALVPVVKEILADNPDATPSGLIEEVGVRIPVADRPGPLSPNYWEAAVLYEAEEHFARTEVPSPDSSTSAEAA